MKCGRAETRGYAVGNQSWLGFADVAGKSSSCLIMRPEDLDSPSVCVSSRVTWFELLRSSAARQPQVSTSSHLGWRWCAQATRGKCVLGPWRETSRSNPGAISSLLMVLIWTCLILSGDRVTLWCQVTGEVPVNFTHCLLVWGLNVCVCGCWVQSSREGTAPQPWCLCCLYDFYDWHQLWVFAPQSLSSSKNWPDFCRSLEGE